jgi:Protein of unknown function (DUF1643)
MNYILKEAVFTNGVRTGLQRVWDSSRPVAVVLMKSPGPADDVYDDRTTLKTSKILDMNGFGGYFLFNIKVGMDYLNKMLIPYDTVILAYGYGETFQDPEVFQDKSILCFGRNKDGSPKLPTRLANTTVLTRVR